MKRAFKWCLSAIASVLFVASGAQAADYPTRPVTVIVPYSAGGGIDVMARTLCQELTKILGQPFVVENKTGAGGTVGAHYVARSAPDGYTLMVAANLETAQLTVKGVQYDLLKDLTPVGLLTSTALILVSHPDSGIKTVPDLISKAKASPGKVAYGSSGVGTIHHLAGEAFMRGLGVDTLHVPYKGSGQSIHAVLGNTVPLLMTSFTAAGGSITAGKLNLLAVTSGKRLPTHPNVPSMGEFVKGYHYSVENGLFAPGKLPPEVLAKLSAAVKKATASPAFAKRFEELPGTAVTWSSPEEYRAIIENGLKKYGEIVKAVGL